MTKLKLAVIGCGGIANGKHLPSLKEVPEVEIVAFCDIIVERAEKAAAEYGVEGARVYKCYKELLEKEELDVVHVCTPNRSHSEISIAAMEAGCHVMCEKPMAYTAAEAKKMLECAKKTGKKLTIGYQSRYRADSQHLKLMTNEGELGDVYYAKAHAVRRRAVPTWGVFLNEYEQGGGPLIDIGTHALDLTLWLTNNYKPKYCVGTTYHALNNDTNQGNAWGNWDPEKFTVEDSAFGYVVMENGATISVESSWAINMLDTVEASTILCGTKAGGEKIEDRVRINGIRQGRQYHYSPNLESGGVAFYDGGGNEDAATREARQWYNAIINDTDPCVLPEQAYVVTRILEGIYTSAKTGEIYRFEN